jgi:sarcosine oxidase, subunit alpha
VRSRWTSAGTAGAPGLRRGHPGLGAARERRNPGRALFKYHRPRGIVASDVEEPNALVGLGQSDSFEPKARATTIELAEGLEVRSQNHWPSLEFDLGAATARLAPLLLAGFYY